MNYRATKWDYFKASLRQIRHGKNDIEVFRKFIAEYLIYKTIYITNDRVLNLIVFSMIYVIIFGCIKQVSPRYII